MTAGGPNEYGDDSFKNRFIDPDTGEAYFLIVNKKTGKTKVYNEEFGEDKYVGEWDPETGKIKYNGNWWGGANRKDKAFINKQISNGGIKEHAKEIIQKYAPGTDEEKRAEANKLMGDNVSVEDLETLDSVEGTGNDAVVSDRTDTNAFVYPENLRFERQDTVTFTSLVYHTAGFDSTAIQAFQQRKETSEIKERRSSIILPIPGEINAQNTTNWSQGSEMNAIQAAAASAILTAGQEGAGKSIDELKNRVQNLSEGSTGKNVKDALLAAIAGTATGKGTQLLTRTTGMVLNPNMEALFSGPVLRDFTFNFKLTPRSATEGKTILRIIRLFKQAMAPQRTLDNLFLKTPNTFEIKYSYQGDSHHALNKFKECALTQCTVGYTPSSNYSTYKDGVMTQYTMGLTFRELVPIYNDDYGDESNVPAEIGF